VRIEPPSSDHVAAGRRRECAAEAGEQWSNEQEGRADLAPELGVQLVAREVGRLEADLVLACPLDLDTELGEERDHRLDIADPRDVAERHRLVRQQARREDRQRAVLVAGDGDPAVQRPSSLDHERLGDGFGDGGLRHARGYPSVAVEPTRERAWETLNRYTKSEALLRHALAVEAAVGAYAQRFGEDEELWRVTALLHDFDYEIHPTLDQHPQDGAPILREEGYPDEVVEGVLSHGSHLGLPRDTPLKKTLFACDELAGFVHACGLVRPDGIETLESKSVRKKLKQPSFAAGVNRQDVYEGAEALGVDLDEHIAFVVTAMRPIAGELGLRTG
jgi:putative nucleotidyltransferase with HDIG domain